MQFVERGMMNFSFPKTKLLVLYQSWNQLGKKKSVDDKKKLLLLVKSLRKSKWNPPANRVSLAKLNAFGWSSYPVNNPFSWVHCALDCLLIQSVGLFSLRRSLLYRRLPFLPSAYASAFGNASAFGKESLQERECFLCCECLGLKECLRLSVRLRQSEYLRLQDCLRQSEYFLSERVPSGKGSFG